MKKVIYSILALGLLASCSGGNQTNEDTSTVAEHATIEGVNLPTKLSLNKTELILNGAGVRSFLFIKIYVGGLYLPAKTHDPKEIINADEPSVIRFHAISRAFTSERMAKTVREQFEKSNPGKTAEFKTRLDILCDMLAKETIQIGDECDISYTPNEGIRVSKNGKDLNILLSGLDFKKALWSDWLSDIPADESLKKAMLGL